MKRKRAVNSTALVRVSGAPEARSEMTPHRREDPSRRDERLFRSWKARVQNLGAATKAQGLPDDAYNTRTPRFKLIDEIHADIAQRFPLGIARDLSHVLDALNVDNDQEAIEILSLLAHEERLSRIINGGA